MAFDREQVLLLLQKRYNSLKKIEQLTDELQDAFARQDELSASLVLEMRAEELAQVDDILCQIWNLAQIDRAAAQEVRRFMNEDPFSAPRTDSWEENKIFEVRRKTVQLLEKLRDKDRRINLRVGGEKSYYRKKEENTA